MQTLSFRESSKRAAAGACGICLALALSYLEHLIPLQALIPIPGFKLGLANIVVILIFYRQSPAEAFIVSTLRCIISCLLFGSFTTLLYSLSGALFSFCSLILTDTIFKGKLSFIGVSVTCAVFHNIGQLIVAAYFFSVGAVIYMLPQLLICALLCGAVTGSVITALPRSVFYANLGAKKSEDVS